MEDNIISSAKKLMMNSSIIKIRDKKEIEKVLENAYLFPMEKDFYDEYGKHDFNYSYDRLEGFNKNGKIYLNPMFATPHSVIHHALHVLSSKYNENGEKVADGIQLDTENWREKMLNEGLTDYLARKISKEETRAYKAGNYFFENMDKITTKRYNEDYLMKIYLTNNQEKLRNFFREYGGEEIEESVFKRKGILGKKEIEQYLCKIDKKVDKEIKQEKIINKIKKIFRISSNRQLAEKNDRKNEEKEKNEEKFNYFKSLKVEVNNEKNMGQNSKDKTKAKDRKIKKEQGR